MNYSQKRTLVGRIVYIALTLMAVTVLIVTMYTFFGGSKKNDPLPPVTDSPITTDVPEDRPSDVTLPNNNDRPVGDDETDPPTDTTDEFKPTDVPPKKDWTKLKVMMPIEGVVYKKHDLTNAVYSVTMNDYRVHQGIDIECNAGDDVLSCAYGVVKTVGYDPFMGYTVVIDHGDGLVSYYKNLSDEAADNVAEGQEVYAGQKLGTVGDSAIIEISDEAHLHFELVLEDEPINPLDMLEYDEEAAASAAAGKDK